MSEKLEALWLVKRHDPTWSEPDSYKIFRTRQAARKYAKDKGERSKRYHWVVMRATWGPEQ